MTVCDDCEGACEDDAVFELGFVIWTGIGCPVQGDLFALCGGEMDTRGCGIVRWYGDGIGDGGVVEVGFKDEVDTGGVVVGRATPDYGMVEVVGFFGCSHGLCRAGVDDLGVLRGVELMEVQVYGWFDLRLPGASKGRWRLGSCYVVHVREGGVVWMGQVVGLGALDVRTGDCAGLGFEVRVVRLEYAFQAAAGAPVFCAAGDAREVEEGDAFALGFDQGDEAAEGDIDFAPSARCVEYPAVSFNVQDLNAVGKEGAYEAATARAGGFAGRQVCPDGVVGCPMSFPGRDACPGLGIAEVCEKWAVKGEELHIQEVSMAVVHGVAIRYTHGGPFGCSGVCVGWQCRRRRGWLDRVRGAVCSVRRIGFL